MVDVVVVEFYPVVAMLFVVVVQRQFGTNQSRKKLVEGEGGQ